MKIATAAPDRQAAPIEAEAESESRGRGHQGRLRRNASDVAGRVLELINIFTGRSHSRHSSSADAPLAGAMAQYKNAAATSDIGQPRSGYVGLVIL